MKVEKVGGAGFGFQDRNGRSPMVMRRLSGRKVVQGDKPRDVGGADRGAAGDVLEVAGQLRPEAGFHIHILAHADHAAIHQFRLGRNFWKNKTDF